MTSYGTDIGDDPFMTHDRAVMREMHSMAPSQPLAASRTLPPGPADTDVGFDPFMQSIGPSARASQNAALEDADVAADPFLTHSQLRGGVGSTGKRRKTMADILGPGDRQRTPGALRALVLLPSLTFVWMMLLWLVLRHFSHVTSVVMTLALCLWAGGCILLGLGPKKGGSVSYLALGVLCLVAIGSGYIMGQYGWNRFWRQMWWTQTGYLSPLTSSETPAMSRIDSGVLDFHDEGGKMMNRTTVGTSFSAGYKKGSTYCVAPIMSPFALTGGYARVNYWAIGIDCCDLTGSFTCDGSRNAKGRYGVVMLDEGMPCPGCNREKFMLAVAKAEAVHGLVSARGALFVRYVAESSDVTFWSTLQAVMYMLFSCLAAGLLLYALGYVSWHHGYGLRRDVPGSGLLNGGFQPKQADDFSNVDLYATMQN